MGLRKINKRPRVAKVAERRLQQHIAIDEDTMSLQSSGAPDLRKLRQNMPMTALLAP